MLLLNVLQFDAKLDGFNVLKEVSRVGFLQVKADWVLGFCKFRRIGCWVSSRVPVRKRCCKVALALQKEKPLHA